MPVSLICNNSYVDDKNKTKKCGQIDPYMDPKTEKVYCPNCDSELVASHFVKITLKNLKQFRQKQTAPFSVKCQNCSKESQPIVLNNDVVCPACNKKHEHLSEPFVIMLKIQLKPANKDI